MEFTPFAKIPRLNRECVILRRLNGTNAQVFLYYTIKNADPEALQSWVDEGTIINLRAGSRTRWVTPKSDNAGFAQWVVTHAEELKEQLGPGQHIGEWYGNGIQRGYGLLNGDKRFALFNVGRWTPDNVPDCCTVVPVLYRGPFNTDAVNDTLESLWKHGSFAVPGYNRPEGIVIYHEHAKSYFKVTLENDEMTKGEADYRARQAKGTKDSTVSYREHLEAIGTHRATDPVNQTIQESV